MLIVIVALRIMNTTKHIVVASFTWADPGFGQGGGVYLLAERVESKKIF